MKDQNELRERTKKYQEEQGVKSCFVCRIVGIEEAYYSRWRQGKKELNEECYFSLNQFLESKNY